MSEEEDKVCTQCQNISGGHVQEESCGCVYHHETESIISLCDKHKAEFEKKSGKG